MNNQEWEHFRRAKTRRRVELLREQARKQILLKDLREHLERDFLIADNFYQTECTDHISPEEYENEKKNAERRKKERQLQRERQERERRRRKKQILLKDLREHIERDFLIADNFYQTQCTAYISPEEYEIEKINAERRKKERQEKARHQKEKQVLLKSLREHIERNFLTADNFYQARCTNHISPKEYETEKINYVQSWAEGLGLEYPPDPEQAAAIGAVEGNVQVVARAGSGKTATLVNRALFLQQHCGVAPDEMLLLAFNRKAAKEMHDRLNSYLQGSIPHVMTFHALAHALIHPEKILGEESQSHALQNIINHYLRDPNYYDKVRALMLAHFRADWEHIVSGGYHKTPEELLRYRRLLPRESLDGTYVKSSPEKVIANFLFEHDIGYTYERKFPWNNGSYHPDFTIGHNRGVIIEYFGLEGTPDYDARSEQKRDYWRNERKWKLLEFSPDDLRSNGVEGFYTLLKQELEDCEIPCNRLSEEEIWSRIEDRVIYRFTTVAKGFINRCRKLSLTPEQLSEKVNNHDYASDVEERFLSLVQVFYESYLERIQATGEEDYDGLMKKAAECVATGKTVFGRKSGSGDLKRIRYVLIDEYQDFSELFHHLMEAVQKQNSLARFFCVGDDWQAINGFAGSDLRFFQNFEQSFEDSRKLYVTTNYRSARAIVNAGNALMKERGTPARPHKTIMGKVAIADLGTFDPTIQEEMENPGDNLTPAVLRLVNKIINDGKSIVLLSRKKKNLPWYVNYRDQRNLSIESGLDRFLRLLRARLPDELSEKVTISTAHGYKGLQQDVVIVLDAVPQCYPLIHPNLIFTRIFGDTIERIVAEERRLFYVALTRAVEELFILTEKDNFSPFLEDLERNIKLSRLAWSDYPPLEGKTEHITIRVGNQNRRGPEPTMKIRKLLKDKGYSWDEDRKTWYSTLPAKGFSVGTFADQDIWGLADGITVGFYDHLDNMIELHHVDDGLWRHISDNI